MSENTKRIIKIEIEICGDCPYYDWHPKGRKKRGCSKGATEYKGGSFYEDCPLEFEEVNHE